MTVQELIEKLQNQDPTNRIYLNIVTPNPESKLGAELIIPTQCPIDGYTEIIIG